MFGVPLALILCSKLAFAFNPVAILGGVGALSRSAIGVSKGDFSSFSKGLDTIDGAASAGIETGLLMEELGEPNPFQESDATAEYLDKLTQRAQDVGYTKDEVEYLFGEDIKHSKSVADRVRQLRTGVQLMKKLYALTASIGGKKLQEVNSTESALYAQRNYDMSQKIYNELVRARLEKKENALKDKAAIRSEVKTAVSGYKDQGIELSNGVTSSFMAPSPLIAKAKEIAMDLKSQFVDKLVVLFFLCSLAWALFRAASLFEFRNLFLKLLLYSVVTVIYSQVLDSAVEICFAAANINFRKIETLSREQKDHLERKFKWEIVKDSRDRDRIESQSEFNRIMKDDSLSPVHAPKDAGNPLNWRDQLGDSSGWFNKVILIPFVKHIFDVLIAALIALSPFFIFLGIFAGMRDLGLLVFVLLFGICLIGIVWNTLGYFAGVMLQDTQSVLSQMDGLLITISQILASILVLKKTGIWSAAQAIGTPFRAGIGSLRNFIGETHFADKTRRVRAVEAAVSDIHHMAYEEKEALVRGKVTDWRERATVLREAGEVSRAARSDEVAKHWENWEFSKAHLKEKEVHRGPRMNEAQMKVSRLHHMDTAEKQRMMKEKSAAWRELASIHRFDKDERGAELRENIANHWERGDFASARLQEQTIHRNYGYEEATRRRMQSAGPHPESVDAGKGDGKVMGRSKPVVTSSGAEPEDIKMKNLEIMSQLNSRDEDALTETKPARSEIRELHPRN